MALNVESTCLFGHQGHKPRRDPNHVELLTVDCRICGRMAVLEWDIATRFPAHFEANRQGIANCIRFNRAQNREHPGKFVFWVPRAELPARLQDWSTIPTLRPVAIEDWLQYPTDHASKPIELLRLLARKLHQYGVFSATRLDLGDVADLAIVSNDELRSILNHLQGKRLLDFPGALLSGECFSTPISLTLDGWEQIRESSSGELSNRAFVAMRFNWDADEPLRLEAYAAIKAACRDNGFEASVVNQDHTGPIMDQILREIREARFVIAELTFNNRGVYFESGFARGLGKHVFHVVHKDHVAGSEADGKKIHFDIAQTMYREWTDPADLRSKLAAWIGATLEIPRA